MIKGCPGGSGHRGGVSLISAGLWTSEKLTGTFFLSQDTETNYI